VLEKYSASTIFPVIKNGKNATWLTETYSYKKLTKLNNGLNLKYIILEILELYFI
jgi:hypothetical protein